MTIIKRTIDVFTAGSERPIGRLVAYYVVLAVIVVPLLYAFPLLQSLLFGEGQAPGALAPLLLPDGLAQGAGGAADMPVPNVEQRALLTILALLGTIVLMLPVTWVYMSARQVRGHSQSVVQTLIILPIVVAGVVFVVRDSLALAFSLAGVVAAVRFRTTLRDTRDVVFIFLAIGVGFAAGVNMLGVGALVSFVFNVVLLLTWRYDFGRNALQPSATVQWSDPLNSLAAADGNGGVPDRELVLALTPSKADALADRFDRVRSVLGTRKKKPRFNAVLSLTSDRVGEAQVVVQKVLDDLTKRWKLDEVVTHVGKPSEIYYLVRLGKNVTRDELITAIRARAGDRVAATDVEVGDALAREQKPAP
ncbi:MAG: DUF4956 domain-containing protein [Gemmatimonadaceae bacterium]